MTCTFAYIAYYAVRGERRSGGRSIQREKEVVEGQAPVEPLVRDVAVPDEGRRAGRQHELEHALARRQELGECEQDATAQISGLPLSGEDPRPRIRRQAAPAERAHDAPAIEADGALPQAGRHDDGPRLAAGGDYLDDVQQRHVFELASEAHRARLSRRRGGIQNTTWCETPWAEGDPED